MTATIADDVTNILRPQFPQFRRPAPPAPRLAGEHIPDDAIPAKLLGMSIGVLAAEMKRVRIVHGDEALELAIIEAKRISK